MWSTHSENGHNLSLERQVGKPVTADRHTGEAGLPFV